MIHVDSEVLENMGNEEANPQTVKKLVSKSYDKGVIKIDGSVSLVQQIPWI
jgi:hypothetical protein